MHRYCEQEQITFTRSRPLRKNDNCFVEQKNYSVVRRFAGYARYDTETEWEVLNQAMERNPGVFPGSCLFLGEQKVHSVTREPVPKKQRLRWQPITRLPLIATAIDGMLETTQEQLETLESVRPKPYVLDDHTVARLIRSFTTQLNDLGLYQEQVSQVEAS